MLTSLNLVLGVITLALSAISMFFALQCVLGVFPNRSKTATSSARPPAALLVPAHNEEGNIMAVLNSLKPQVQQHDRIIVVADNCSDRTAELALGAGAEVVTRRDEERRGKGYALHAGLEYLAIDPPPIVVMIDADCIAAPGAIDILITEVATHGRPVQGRYLMVAPPTQPLQTGLAQFAFFIKNHVRPLGLSRLGLGCQLTGSGMAFPWICLTRVDLCHGHLVEDMKLGLELAMEGFSPRYCEAAYITSEFPQSGLGLNSQRQRWEKGRAQLVGDLLRLFLVQLIQRNRHAFSLVLDALVPPILLLVVILTVHTIVVGLLILIGATAWPFMVSLANLMMVIAVLSSVLLVQDCKISARSAIKSLPSFVRDRLRIYSSLVTRGNNGWVRTHRSTDDI